MSKNIKDSPAFALERKVSHKEGGGMFPHQLAYVIQEFIEEKEMPIPQGIKENYLTTQQPTLNSLSEEQKQVFQENLVAECS